MPALRLHLFGGFCACCNDRSLHGFDACKVQELFCYLLLYRKPHPREMLAGSFWGDSSTSQAKKYLRQALWQLQTALEASIGPIPQRVVLVEADRVCLNPAIDLWLDVVEFEQAFALMNQSSGKQMADSTVRALHHAIDLYQGDLLEGCYQDWCLYERARLQNMYLVMLDHLVRHCEANQDFEQGLNYAARVLRYDSARERAHRQMMRLYYRQGDRTIALRQYERCVLALKTELEVGPSVRTVALYNQIKADNLEPLSSPLTSPSDHTELNRDTAVALLPEVLHHLKEVRATLSDIQRQVQKDIRTVEVALISRR
jgi:DNA-binding SARP family transcriptional activator